MGSVFTSKDKSESDELCFASVELDHQLFVVSLNSNHQKKWQKEWNFPLNDFPVDLLRKIVGYLNVIEYIFGILLVCKTWNKILSPMAISFHGTPNSKLFDYILYNSRSKYLTSHILRSVDYNDILHEFWISGSIASVHLDTTSRTHAKTLRDMFDGHSKYRNFSINTYDVLAEVAVTIYHQQFAHYYVLNFIQKCNFCDPSSSKSMNELFLYLSTVLFCGGAICIGFMLELLFEKYCIKYNSNIYKTEFYHNLYFWQQFLYLFKLFYFRHKLSNNHIDQLWIKKQIMSDFLRLSNKYVRLYEKYNTTNKHLPKLWIEWKLRTNHTKTNPLQFMIPNS